MLCKVERAQWNVEEPSLRFAFSCWTFDSALRRSVFLLAAAQKVTAPAHRGVRRL